MDTAKHVGMHPRLEEPKYFPGFHAGLIIEVFYALGPAVPPAYEVTVEQSLSLTNEYGERKDYVPDARIDLVEPARSATATATATDIAPEFLLESPNKPQRFIAIYDGEGILVTTIEILSPANKTGIGYDNLVRKQQTLWGQEVNLVEIDLLRKGRRRWQAERATAPDYLFTVQRAGSTSVEAWSASADQALPTLPVPLRYEDGNVALNLEEVVAAYLRRSGLGRRLGIEL